jgi:hypothetical protein
MSDETLTTITQEYPGIESWVVFAGISPEHIDNIASEIYANPDWKYLKINNPHFNMLHAYDFYVKHSQNEAVIKTHLEQQVETAIAENFIGTGRYDLELITQPDNSAIFSNPSFPDQGLIKTADRAITKKQFEEQPYERELQEKCLAESLTKFYENGKIGDKCLWTSPPGNKDEYQDQMSITYLGEMQASDTSPNHKKLHIELLVHKLSIEGHQKLLEIIDNKDHQHQQVDTDFVGSLYKHPKMTIHQLKNSVKKLEKEYTNPASKPKEYISKTILEGAKPQIKEFCLFLEKALKDTYATKNLCLIQTDIDDLEKAYSLGYRAVVTHFDKKKIIKAQQMEQDYKELSVLKKTKQQLIDGAYSQQEIYALDLYANTYYNQLQDRYGDLRQRIPVGGGGCPGGSLSTFDSEIITINGVEFDFISSLTKEKWSYHNGTCRCCHRTNIDVGPCEICKQCEKEFDNKE